MAPDGGGKQRVFLSYSHADDRWRDRFLVHAKSWDLDVWADPYIRVGDDWHREIGDALDAARIGVCLVSVDFLASDYIREYELKPIREREDITAFLIPVRAAQAYERHGLGALQWPQPPDQPLDALRPTARRDRALGELVQQLAQLVESISPRVDEAEPTLDRVPAEPIEPGDAAGRVWGAPDAERRFRGRRSDQAHVEGALRAAGSGSIGITSTSPTVGVHGRGGLGKTALVAKMVSDERVRRLFPDGVWWLTVGQDPSLRGLQRTLLEGLSVRDLEPDLTLDEGRRLLRSEMAERQALLVLDDVWDRLALEAFDVMGPRGRIIMTTRRAANLSAIEATAIELDSLVGDAARQVLADHAHVDDIATLPKEADEVIEATDGLPLGLAAAGAQVRFGVPWTDLIDRLREGRGAFGPHPQSSQLGALLTAVQALDPSTAARYQELAPYPEDTAIPVAEVEVLWSATAGCSAREAGVVLHELGERGLLSRQGDEIHLHDLQRDLLVLLSDDLAQDHAAVIDAHRGFLRSTEAWWTLPDEHGPFADRLVHHLSAANLVDELERTLGDLRYVATRLSHRGMSGVVADLELARTRTRTPEIEAMARLVARMGFIAENLPVADCASTLRALATGEPALARGSAALTDLIGPVSLKRTVPLPEHARPALLRTIGEPKTTVGGLSTSPDDRYLVTGCRNGSSHMWDPSVRWIDTVKVWDVRTGRAVCSLAGHGDAVLATAVSPDRRWFVSASVDGTLRVWDWGARGPANEVRHVLEGHRGPVTSVAVTADCSTIVSGSNDGTIRRWNAADGRPSGEPLEGHVGRVSAVALDPGGRFIASAGADATVRIWDLSTGDCRAVFEGHQGPVRAVAVSEDGALVASGSEDDTVRLWDVETGTDLFTIRGHAAGVTGVAFAPDGRYLASSSLDTTVRTWDLTTGAPLNVLTGHTDGVKGLAVASRGDVVASVGRDNVLRVWTPDTPGGSVDLGALGPIAGIGASRDGSRVVTARWDGTLRVIGPSSLDEVDRLEGHTDKVVRCAVTSDGSVALSASRDATLRVWDLTAGRCTNVLTGHGGPITGCALVPTERPGDSLAGVSSSTDGTLRSWDLRTGRVAQEFAGHDGPVISCAVTADRSSLVSGGQDTTLRVWELASATTQAVLSGHDGPVADCTVTSDGRQIVSASLDSTLRIWDAASGATVRILRAHHAPVVACALSPDEAHIASVSSDWTIRIWSRSSGEMLCGLRTAGWLGGVAWIAAAQLIAVGAGGVYRLTVDGLGVD